MITILQSAIPSKNAKEIRRKFAGRLFIGKSAAALASTASIMWQLADAKKKKEWKRMLAPFDGSHGRMVQPLFVRFKYWRPDHHRFDYLNAAAILCDCLVKQKYLSDDNADVMLPVFAPYEIDADNPRVEITIIEPR